ncbi:hypothetical protein DdX_18119 [Ditylenchus destructor]|uniref:Uncharacterized protein n=1 Tax=Ditylenchus destructor TaxID=166010 RepID=A0AAD4MQN3_9BILA|nr:hypothetical protein DdX_18119 [Ditylenchus destructor]
MESNFNKHHGAKPKNFAPGAFVYLQHFKNQAWYPGTVHSVNGKVGYWVDNHFDGKRWYCHANQVKPRYRMDDPEECIRRNDGPAFVQSPRSADQRARVQSPQFADQHVHVQSPQYRDQRARVFRPRRDVAPFPERFLPRNEENATPRQNRYVQRSPYQLRSQCARQCLL